jgi:glycosyltransferase involved in cell wall biosynthesis
MPEISVIIPNYNHARFLKKRIESVLKQTFKDIEIIILDDKSTDNSKEIIESFASLDKRIVTHYNEVNSGSTFVQWNKGVKMAKGTYIWIAESDDYAEPDFLSSLLPFFKQSDTIGIAFCHSHIIDDQDQTTGNSSNWLSIHETNREFSATGIKSGIDTFQNFTSCFNIIPNASAVLMKKEIYIKVGGADETMKMAGDWKLWSSIMMISDIGFLNNALNYHRRHSSGVTSKKLDILKKEAIQNIKYFYQKLNELNLRSPQIDNYFFDWCFKKFAWEAKYELTINNYFLFKNKKSPLFKKSIIELLYNAIKNNLIFILIKKK